MKTNNHQKVLRMVLAALFLALAYVLPFATGQIPRIGNLLCPMHLPVLLCGFLCGWYWGLTVGFVAPLLRSLTLGMPILFPGATCMAFELATYGLVAGLLLRFLPRRRLNTYIALIVAMIAGRLVWGAAMAICLGISGGALTLQAFMASALTNAIPGIVIQLVAVPLIVERCRDLV